ncbi:iron-containing redox enzyme family protein [Endozoicomonas numazuensis]|uniref:Uncharacterized protein n=1 Tax=Endozoicomonas numazuensis TaxID=1137799 RepID=A0A081NL32_9GAMM|nr:iron-containing redox enzyme family protein [Endozoicomonas numazuensis]KEQ19155.1 hypothetical protein GZ78_03920 [Endozoicomonas numazuensis]
MFQDSLHTLCCQLSQQYSRELTEDEIIRSIHIYKFPTILGSIWSFTGHFYKWPQTLLTRDDLPESTRTSLEENLQDELGRCGTAPHTQMFMDMAKSMGVTLDGSQPPGPLMAQTLKNAKELPVNRAIGAFFANESQSKWGGFINVFSNQPGINMEFFNIHARETQHTQSLLNGVIEDDITDLLSGVIAFSKSRATFMNSIRSLITKPVAPLKESNIPLYTEQLNY